MPDLEDRDESGRTPLLHAARWGDLDVVELFVNEGADMDAKGKLGWNALMIAARWGHIPILEYLLLPRKVEGQPGKCVPCFVQCPVLALVAPRALRSPSCPALSLHSPHTGGCGPISMRMTTQAGALH